MIRAPLADVTALKSVDIVMKAARSPSTAGSGPDRRKPGGVVTAGPGGNGPDTLAGLDSKD